MKPFRIVTGALPDGSAVYSVHGENQSGRIVIDCIDAAHAETLRSTLERATSAFEVFPVDSVPELDGDKGRILPAHCYVERRIVANLIAHLQRAGFAVHSVHDGEELHRIRNGGEREAIKRAMEHVFSVDESSLRFRKAGFNVHGVLIIGGNGVDIISDWNYTEGDPDGFSAAMDAFDAEQFQ